MNDALVGAVLLAGSSRFTVRVAEVASPQPSRGERDGVGARRPHRCADGLASVPQRRAVSPVPQVGERVAGVRVGGSRAVHRAGQSVTVDRERRCRRPVGRRLDDGHRARPRWPRPPTRRGPSGSLERRTGRARSGEGPLGRGPVPLTVGRLTSRGSTRRSARSGSRPSSRARRRADVLVAGNVESRPAAVRRRRHRDVGRDPLELTWSRSTARTRRSRCRSG